MPRITQKRDCQIDSRTQLIRELSADYKSEHRIMSKKYRPGFWLIVSLGLLFVLLFITTLVAATGIQGSAAATSTARNAAIVATTQAVLKETSETRELQILR